jgi:hypothetical protein
MVAVAGIGLLYFNRQGQDGAGPVTTGPSLSVQVLIRAGADTLANGPLTAAAPLAALSALEQSAANAKLPVGIRQYDFGKLVVSIGGYTAGSDGDWTYRVNDSLIPVAAENCQLADGDRLEFRFGKAASDSL